MLRTKEFICKRKRSYSPTNLTKAYQAVKDEGLPVYRAAKEFRVPLTTLRDRVDNRVSIDCTKTGPEPLLSQIEEAKLVKHLQDLASVGYGYTRAEVVSMATDYAIYLGKKQKNEKGLSMQWFYSFMERWPELRVVKPSSLSELRAKNASESSICSYFQELESILDKYSLKDKPHLIYNIDEKGINTEYKPPNIVAGRGYQPQTVMAEKSKTVTIIGAGNALGNQIPPFFVFPGKRMMPELFNGKSVGTDGLMTPSGWSNSEVFRFYMKSHFLKYVQGRNPSDTILALYDGHRSHISLDLIDWAKNNNIVLFVLPPHCSHILQPLDVGCFGPFQLKYNQECLSFSRQTHKTVTRFDVCALACKAYISALSPSNIQSAFSKSGIYPFQSAEAMLQNLKQKINPSILYDKGDGDKASPSDNYEAVEKHTADCTGDNSINEATENEVGDFFMKRGGEVNKKIEVVKKKRRNISNVIGGKAVTEDDILEKMKNYMSESSKKSNISSKFEIDVTKSLKRKKKNHTKIIDKENQAGPSTGLASSEKYLAPLIDSSEDENGEEMAEKDNS